MLLLLQNNSTDGNTMCTNNNYSAVNHLNEPECPINYEDGKRIDDPDWSPDDECQN